MRLSIEVEPENDGRWIAEVPELSGALSYGATSAGRKSDVRVVPTGY